MPQGRRSSSASSDGSPRWRSRSRGASPRHRSQSRDAFSRARSKSRGPSFRQRSRSREPLPRRQSDGSHDRYKKEHSGPSVKGSILFLGTIAAATYAAHKVWPKGVLYGHKEDWEHEHDEATHKKSKRATRQSERDQALRDGRDCDDEAPPVAVRGFDERSRRREVQDRGGYVTRDTLPSQLRREPTWVEERRRQDLVGPAGRNASYELDQCSQSTGSGSGSGHSARKYLPYEPGRYTPSSVLSARSADRDRPIPLPIEHQRGGHFSPLEPQPRFYEVESRHESRDPPAMSQHKEPMYAVRGSRP